MSSDKTHDPHIDTLVSMLGGGSKDTDMETALLQDFTMFLSMMLFKMLILGRSDGKELADKLLLEWRKRVIDNHAQQMAQIRQAQEETCVGQLFGSLMDTEGLNKRYMEAFDKVVKRIETLIKANVKAEDGE